MPDAPWATVITIDGPDDVVIMARAYTSLALALAMQAQTRKAFRKVEDGACMVEVLCFN